MNYQKNYKKIDSMVEKTKIFENKISDDSLLTINDLSIWLNIKVRTLYNMVYLKHIPYIKIGSRLRFCKNNIKEWLSLKE